MALIIDGTSLSEYGDALYNGSTVNKIICNDKVVWEKIIFNAKWSGSSYAHIFGIQTSGSLFRYKNGKSWYGKWLTALSNGTFTSASSVYGGYGFKASGNNLIMVGGVSEGVVSFNPKDGFSGSTEEWLPDADLNINSSGFETSGGKLRYWDSLSQNTGYGGMEYGAWITLK